MHLNSLQAQAILDGAQTKARSMGPPFVIAVLDARECASGRGLGKLDLIPLPGRRQP